MSLYDDIFTKDDPSSDNSKDWSTKSSSIKLLQDHLQIKRTTSNILKNTNRKQHGQFNKSSLKAFNDVSSLSGMSLAHTDNATSLLGGDWDVNEEYDPMKPNDYEKIIKEKSEKKSNTSNFQVTAIRSLGLDYDDEDDDDYEENKFSDAKSKSKANASFAPPPSLLENVEKAPNPSMGFEVSSIAAKIMAKMGYKEGQGLGKEEQGISKALQVEKTGKSHGKIIYEEDKKPEEPSITDVLKNPSKLVLLRNMVGPGDVDSELEPETKEECSKYGQVRRCYIYEFKEYDNEEDAVRIFIQFERIESAIKALIDLNGRYFGGRIVKASFYDCDRFDRGDYTY